MARAKAVFLLATDTSCPRGDSETWSSKHLPGPRVPFPQRNLAQFHPEKEVQEEEEGRVTPSQPSFKGLCAPPPVCRALVLLGEGADGSHSTPGAWLRGPVWHVADPQNSGLRTRREGGKKQQGSAHRSWSFQQPRPCPHRGLLWALPTWSLIEPQGQRGPSAIW